MGTRESYSRTILVACTAVGGEEQLARRLGVPANAVIDWILGSGPDVPTDVFLKAVDLVLTHTHQELSATSAMLKAIRERRLRARK